jgi:hypothetical protein
MGERIIRPGIRTSERTEKLVREGGWMAQVFYDWALTVVDDYGRFDGRPSILRTEIFPLLLDLVRDSDVQRCLAACEKAGLIRLYSADGKPYMEILDFRQRLRASKSRWPAPPCVSLSPAGHCHDNANGYGDGYGDGNPQPPERSLERPKKPTTPTIPPSLASPVFDAAWADFAKHRREMRKPLTATSSEKLLQTLAKMGQARAVAAIHHSIANGWQGIFEEREGPGHGRLKPKPIDINAPGKAFASERANTEKLNEIAAREAAARMGLNGEKP